jgi:hypothetical protein
VVAGGQLVGEVGQTVLVPGIIVGPHSGVTGHWVVIAGQTVLTVTHSVGVTLQVVKVTGH